MCTIIPSGTLTIDIIVDSYTDNKELWKNDKTYPRFNFILTEIYFYLKNSIRKTIQSRVLRFRKVNYPK